MSGKVNDIPVAILGLRRVDNELSSTAADRSYRTAKGFHELIEDFATTAETKGASKAEEETAT